MPKFVFLWFTTTSDKHDPMGSGVSGALLTPRRIATFLVPCPRPPKKSLEAKADRRRC